VKILVVSNLYPPNAVGGYERLVAGVASALAGRGHAIRVLTSAYGGARPGAEDLQVERSLQLLTGDTIYRPFSGTGKQRDRINRENVSLLSRKIEVERPDAILVGNLFFFDRTILEPLREQSDRVVYLLTDVWRIHFADDDALQEYFRRSVFKPSPGQLPLVPADAPGLLLERLESRATRVLADEMMAAELARRRRLESGLAQGRSVFQYSGECHLCGPTVFTVSSAGPSTLMLPAREVATCACGRCGLDGDVRGAIHGFAQMGATGSPGAALIATDPGLRDFLRRRFPDRRVTTPADLLQDGAGCDAAVYLDAAPEPEELSRLRDRVRPEGVFVSLMPRGGVTEGWVTLRFWSQEAGYFGRDYQIALIPAAPLKS
jgi:hypothetical protein